MTSPEPQVDTRWDDDEKLPLHVPTKLLALARRWRWMAIVLLASMALAGLAGILLGSRTYRAESVLLFRRAADSAGEIGKSTYLETQLHTVKLPQHLEILRQRLEIPASLEALGSATGAYIRTGTGLMVIDARWESASGAAEIANTLREIFLASHLRMMAREAARELELRSAEARDQFEAVEIQLQRLGGLEGEVRQRIDQDRRARPEEEGLGDVNIRVERLRDAIIDDQKQRWNEAELTKRTQDLDRVGRLASGGLVPRSELDRVAAEVAKQEALTVDTAQTGQWKSELDRLLAVALPSESATSPSAPVLQEMLLKDFNLRLDRVRWGNALAELEAATKEMESLLAQIRSGDETTGPLARELTRFQVVSEARAPRWPELSTRRTVALAVWVLLSGAGMAGLVAWELLDTRLKSASECQWYFEKEVLVGLARGASEVDPATLRLLAGRLSKYRCVQIIGVAARSDSNLGRLLEQIAETLRRDGSNVTIIDCDRSPEELAGTEFLEALSRTGEEADLILLRSTVTDRDMKPALLAERADATLVFTSAHHARRGHIRAVLESLEGWVAPILGIAIDHIEPEFLAL
ncbi:MAG: hypothetical protein MPN21_16180 [Thermoanaerobaculia bacterium]|nr:hypothetical protein [Thermoanaerobaculia bacterium]